MENEHIPPQITRICPCGTTYPVYNLIDFSEDGTPFIAKQFTIKD